MTKYQMVQYLYERLNVMTSFRRVLIREFWSEQDLVDLRVHLGDTADRMLDAMASLNDLTAMGYDI